eukprot:GFKZ01002470.1.p2 GENE.GFKZ01002470.1~~GFKZ01002470.1.p2  ORF type:complete len:116 (+),score=9.96 GFKZ01002470.1:270-617(+)
MQVEPGACVPNPSDKRQRVVATIDLPPDETLHELQGPNGGTEKVNAMLGEDMDMETAQDRRCDVQGERTARKHVLSEGGGESRNQGHERQECQLPSRAPRGFRGGCSRPHTIGVT